MRVNTGRIHFDEDELLTNSKNVTIEDIMRATYEEAVKVSKKGDLVHEHTSTYHINRLLNQVFFKGVKNYILESEYAGEGAFELDTYSSDPLGEIRARQRFNEKIFTDEITRSAVAVTMSLMEDANWKKWLVCYFAINGKFIQDTNFRLLEKFDEEQIKNIDKSKVDEMIELNKKINLVIDTIHEDYLERYNIVINEYIDNLLDLVPEQYRDVFESDIRDKLGAYTTKTNTSNLYEHLKSLKVKDENGEDVYYFPHKNLRKAEDLRTGKVNGKGQGNSGILRELQQLTKLPKSKSTWMYNMLDFSYKRYNNSAYAQSYQWLFGQFNEVTE